MEITLEDGSVMKSIWQILRKLINNIIINVSKRMHLVYLYLNITMLRFISPEI